MNIDIKTADGEEVELGGAYYDGRGTEYRAVGVRLVDYRHIPNVSLSCLTGKIDDLCCVSMRPNELYSTPPDSWEKLDEDLDRCIEESNLRLAPSFVASVTCAWATCSRWPMRCAWTRAISLRRWTNDYR